MSATDPPTPDGPTYDPQTGTYHLQYDGDADLSTVVVIAVAEIAGVDPIELEPLYESVDPDVLNDLFGDGAPRVDDAVSFAFAGHEVSVESDGRVTIRPPESAE